MVESVVKAKVGDLEEEIKEGFLRRLRREMTGMVMGVIWEEELLDEVI